MQAFLWLEVKWYWTNAYVLGIAIRSCKPVAILKLALNFRQKVRKSNAVVYPGGGKDYV